MASIMVVTNLSRRTLMLGSVGIFAGCAAVGSDRSARTLKVETQATPVPGSATPSLVGRTGEGWRTKAMSFNVLTPSRPASDFNRSIPPGETAFSHRMPAIVDWIRRCGPDLIGLQENEATSAAVLPMRRLEPKLREYTVLCPKLGVPLLIRDSAYSVAKSGAIDLSQGFYPRYLVWAQLEHRGTGGRLLVANTHLDPYQKPERMKARAAEVALIIKSFRKLNQGWKTPTLLLGDLNLRPNDPRPEYAAAVAKLLRSGLRDSARVARKDLTKVKNAASVNGFGDEVGGSWRYRAIRNDGFRYDYVLCSPGIDVRSWEIVTGPGVRRIGSRWYFANGPVPSDHCPVLAEVTVPV